MLCFTYMFKNFFQVTQKYGFYFFFKFKQYKQEDKDHWLPQIIIINILVSILTRVCTYVREHDQLCYGASCLFPRGMFLGLKHIV